MFLIVLHHYCVTSGLLPLISPSDITPQMVFVQFMSVGGKCGVNIFFLLSGYFLCRSKMKWSKVWVLLIQILSINLLLCLFLSLLGYNYSLSDYAAMFPLLGNVPESFLTTYVMLYLLSPYINKALDTFSRRDFTWLLLILLTYFSVLPSLLLQETWHYLGWGFTMYCTGAYIRHFKVNEWRLPFGLICTGLLLLTWGGILLLNYLSSHYSKDPMLWMFAIADANRLNIFLLSASLLLMFANLRIRTRSWINIAGGTVTLGVLYWHSGNHIVRQWLWNDLLQAPQMINSEHLWLHCLLSVLGVYLICTLIELLRQRVIDHPLRHFLKKQKA